MIRILHIIQQLTKGGASRSLIATSKYSAQLGQFQHSIISLKPADSLAVEFAEKAQLNLINSPQPVLIQQEIEKADIVQIHFWNNPEIYEVLYSQLPAMRLLIWCHIAGDHPPHIITNDLVNFADFVIPCNPYSAELAVFNTLSNEVKLQKTKIVYDAADFARLENLKPRVHDSFNVGYIGEVDFVKMHPRYVPMSAKINLPDVKFIVCGRGIEQELRHQAQQLGVGERFQFLGYVEDIKSVLETLDVYGYPVREDTYAAAELNLQEAMYAGIPPVVFPHGGIKRLVIHNETGLLVNSELEYQQAIEYLYYHPEDRKRLGLNAKAYAEQYFGAENAAKQLNPVYEQMIKLPKQKRVWGVPVGENLLDQPISFEDLVGDFKKRSGAELLIESLENFAPQFQSSLNSKNLQEVFAAEQKIATSSPVLFHQFGGGILHYRDYYPQDSNLRLWSGLVLQRQGNHQEAIAQFQEAIKLQFNHWRIYWYLAYSAHQIGNKSLTEQCLKKVLEEAPDFQLAQEMLHKLGDRTQPQKIFSWNKFQNFTYSKQTHLQQFRRFGQYQNINFEHCDLEAYQDLLIYNFIIANFPLGSKLLEIGGGNSRVIEALKLNYECWNLDKLEGMGNGPTQIQNIQGYRLVQDYIGNFSAELPVNYFDCVFSISTLEHVPQDEATFQNIHEDINRILKPGGISFHCFDVVLKTTETWTNQLLPYLFNHVKSLNSMIPFAQMQQDSDLYVMSEAAYNQYWRHLTKTAYQEFGQPLSYQIAWQKQETSVLPQSPTIILQKTLPKISIVTPSFNQAEFLEECIDSVLSQNYPNLEYIVMDGGSQDSSVEIIQKYEKYLTYWQSQPDGGHYLALNAGFKKTTGEIMAWINSDDKYHPDAFFKVAAVFRQYPDVEWIMGIPTEWDRQGRLIHTQMQTPLWSRQALLQKQWVRQNQILQHTWIQQESTFWKRSLWEKSGAKLRDDLQFAGDFELWLRFSRYVPLYLVRTLMGGFRTYESQRSKNYREQYLQEVEKVVQTELQLIHNGEYTAEIPAPAPIFIQDSEIVSLKSQVLKPSLKVSAIVSTYNAERMMRGRLENLVNQTLFQNGGLEIIVVDSGSQENERAIVEEFQKQYGDHIVYLRTEERETVYAAWNRGIAIARGKYITNQNTDDRMKLNAIEGLAKYLDQHPQVVLVHGDQQAVTQEETVNIQHLNGEPHWKWSDFSPLQLLFLAQVGSQPMWRKSLHHQYGLFDASLKIRGDQDFYIRISKAGAFHFIPEVLGTVNISPNSWSHQQELSAQEAVLLFQRYTVSREQLAKFMGYNPEQINDEFYQTLVNNLCCELVDQVLPRFNLPFYAKQIIDLLNSVLDLGSHQQTVKNNIVRILERFSDESIRSQLTKDLNPILNPFKQQKNILGKTMEKINDQPLPKNLTLNVPKIEQISTSTAQPFWSVMIPTYKGSKFLKTVLESVLSQAASSTEMQIEVVDDCSPDEDIKSLVEKLGGNRVSFYRQPQNLGLVENWNDCIRRAKGKWVHILHQDDVVLPGFYHQLQTLLEKEPNAGAAFCRHYYIDESGKQRFQSPLEQDTPGILTNWLERIAVMQRIQCASIVVKRNVYETIGGFCADAGSAADWEMWKRISAYYPVAYHPETLACYRWHSASESSRLIAAGSNISDTRKSIEISQSYLPPEKALSLSTQAKEHYAFTALNTAKDMLEKGQEKSAISQIQEALLCSQSDSIKAMLVSLFVSTKEEVKASDSAKLLSEILNVIQQYKAHPTHDKILNRLRDLRYKIAENWLNLPFEKLENAYKFELGKSHQALLNSGIKNETLIPQEQKFLDKILAYLQSGLHQPQGLQYLFAMMLYCYPHQVTPNWYVQAPLPKWFLKDYLQFMLATPQYFQKLGEADQYYRYMRDWIEYCHSRIFSEPASKLWQEVAWVITQNANLIPLYFNTANLKEIYIKRAEIMELALKSLGYELDYQFPPRPASRSKIRLGILSLHVNPQTETYSTLPVFEHLDRNKFEIRLYAVQTNNHPLEQYCKSRVDQFVKLPKNIKEQVKTIRLDDLDILLIGTNVTATTHQVTLLAMHRLARIQVTSTSCCTTTGMPTLDYYISGTLTEPSQGAEEHYREKLMLLEGTAHCFNYYAIPAEQPTQNPSRSSLGISDDAVIFISGANFYKIIPELRETWAKILEKVPNSVLILYPFNPNWTNHYARIPFIKSLRATLAQSGISHDRLIILDAQPSREDIKAYLKLADVYLDSYPFSGVNSLIDPLEVGLVPVVRDGDLIPAHPPTNLSELGQIYVIRESSSFRSIMGASLLRSLSISDLITNSEDSYIDLAVNLAQNLEFRQQKRLEIQQKMLNNPEFLDSRSYSAKVGILLEQLFQTEQQKQQLIALQTPEAIKQYLSDLVTFINHYDLDHSNQKIVHELQKLRKVIADFWLKIPPEHLEQVYNGHLGKGYQLLLKRGMQQEPLTQSEQIFLSQLTQEAIGLKKPDSLNCLMVAMLYYPPGKMLVQDAGNRLPQWLLKDYQEVFENQAVMEKIQPITSSQPTLQPSQSSPLTATFQNRLFGCLNLYHIDPSEKSIIEELRQMRQQIAEFCLSLNTTDLEPNYQGQLGQIHRAFLKSNFRNHELTEAEHLALRQLATGLSQGLETSKAFNYLLAAMLYCRPGHLQIKDTTTLPKWLQQNFEALMS